MKINCIDAEDFLKDIYILPQNGEAKNMSTPKYPRLSTTTDRYLWFDSLFDNEEADAFLGIKKWICRQLPDRKSTSAVRHFSLPSQFQLESFPFTNWAENVFDNIRSNLEDVRKNDPHQAESLLENISKGIFTSMLNFESAAKSDLMQEREKFYAKFTSIQSKSIFFIKMEDYLTFNRYASSVIWADWKIAVWDRMMYELRKTNYLLESFAYESEHIARYQ